jgi:hypothetical protein
MRNSDAQTGSPEAALPDMHFVNGDVNSRERAAAQRPTEQATERGDKGPSLLTAAQAAHFRDQWGDLQARFVDDPQDAVSDADRLVSEALEELTKGFEQQKRRLEATWASGGGQDTEELRRTLQRYRVFFHQLIEA